MKEIDWKECVGVGGGKKKRRIGRCLDGRGQNGRFQDPGPESSQMRRGERAWPGILKQGHLEDTLRYLHAQSGIWRQVSRRVVVAWHPAQHQTPDQIDAASSLASSASSRAQAPVTPDAVPVVQAANCEGRPPDDPCWR